MTDEGPLIQTVTTDINGSSDGEEEDTYKPPLITGRFIEHYSHQTHLANSADVWANAAETKMLLLTKDSRLVLYDISCQFLKETGKSIIIPFQYMGFTESVQRMTFSEDEQMMAISSMKQVAFIAIKGIESLF